MKKMKDNVTRGKIESYEIEKEAKELGYYTSYKLQKYAASFEMRNF